MGAGDGSGAGSSSAAATTQQNLSSNAPAPGGQGPPPPHAAAAAAGSSYAAPAPMQQPGGYPAQPGGYPGGGYPPPGSVPYSVPPPQNARPPMISIISPEDAKKIRKMQWINFGATMMQLACSLAVILIVRNNLISLTFGQGTPIPTFNCLAATPAWPGTCEYAYSLASVSIFFGFILSLMQCLTMDCCGAGRLVEAGFDAAASAWWIAGGITLGLRASEANAADIPAASSRNAVVAMCWLSAGLFLVLLSTNLVLIKRLGRAYKAAAQQMQQHMTAYPATAAPAGYAPGAYPGASQGVQMVPMGGPGGSVPPGPPGGYNGGGYPPQPAGGWGGQQQGMGVGGAPGPQQGPPAGYPTQFTPPPHQGGPGAV